MGASHMCIITKNGMAFTAGRGNEGQLGRKLLPNMNGVLVIKPEPEKEEESEEKICSYFCEAENFGSNNKATTVACGEKFTLILNDQNKVFSFGDATDGCLGWETLEGAKTIYTPKIVSKLEEEKKLLVSPQDRDTRHAFQKMGSFIVGVSIIMIS